jgi:Domain of unknown function (DUF1906)
MSTYSIIDTARYTTSKTQCLKAAGIQTVIRYYNFHNVNNKEKRLEPQEAKALSAAGFQIAVVFQQKQNARDDFSREIGLKAGEKAWELAKGIGQPNGSAIYFAVDYNATTLDMTEVILPYFEGVVVAMKQRGGGKSDYKIGAYGSGLVVNELLQRRLIDYRWLSMSVRFRGTQKAIEDGEYEFRQLYIKGSRACDLSVDFNVKKTPSTDIGSFIL